MFWGGEPPPCKNRCIGTLPTPDEESGRIGFVLYGFSQTSIGKRSLFGCVYFRAPSEMWFSFWFLFIGCHNLQASHRHWGLGPTNGRLQTCVFCQRAKGINQKIHPIWGVPKNIPKTHPTRQEDPFASCPDHMGDKMMAHCRARKGLLESIFDTSPFFSLGLGRRRAWNLFTPKWSPSRYNPPPPSKKRTTFH